MPRERTFWLLLATLLVAGWGASFFDHRGPHSLRLGLAPDAPPPLAQPAGGRSFRPARFELLSTLPAGGAGAELTLPTVLRVGGPGDLYLLDSGRERVLKIADDGRPRVAYGPAPADIGNPSDLAVAGTGAVWVCDPDGRRITVFTPDGRVARRIEPRQPVFRLSAPDAQGFVATSFSDRSETLFQRYSAAGKLESSFGRFFPAEVQTALTADGWIVDLPDGGFVYLFRHAGLLAAYSRDGRLRYFRRTVVPLPWPEVRVDVGGNQSFGPTPPLASVSGSVVGGAGGELYVLSAEGAQKGRVLDVYGAADGTYRYSLEPPEGDARSVVLTADRLWSAGRRGLTLWRRAG
ncbi:MAG TPA: hypothetical protein VFE33_22590 [Thermoanaerobaculia bacterium]|nr:hypothetical protein [Thermoanaerobaculia bacterium]